MEGFPFAVCGTLSGSLAMWLLECMYCQACIYLNARRKQPCMVDKLREITAGICSSGEGSWVKSVIAPTMAKMNRLVKIFHAKQNSCLHLALLRESLSLY